MLSSACSRPAIPTRVMLDRSVCCPIQLREDSQPGGRIMNRTNGVRSLTVLALVLVAQGCGKEATPPAASAVTPPAAATPASPAPAIASGTGAQALGEDPYKKACAACHDQGVAGAPKIGDKTAW